jgi:cytochrome c oxidase subunit 2
MSPESKRRRALLHAAMAACVLAGGLTAFPARPEERVVRIVARKFEFVPRVVTLKRGTPVILEFTTADVAMGFNCPDFNIRADILPGEKARVRFTPDKAGSFVYLCDLFCGDGHERMSGTLKVTA